MNFLFPVKAGKVKISIFAIISFAAVLYSDFSFFTAEIFIAAIIHELGHICAMKLFDVKIHSVSVLAFGAEISSDAALLPYHKEALTALSGIVFNGVSGVIALAVRIFTNDIYTLFFAVCSLFLALINLVPVPGFDGARALQAILCARLGGERAVCIMDTVHYFAFLLLVLAALYVMKITEGNLSLVIFLCCVFMGVYARKEG